MKERSPRRDYGFFVRKRSPKLYENTNPEDLALQIKADICQDTYEEKLPNRAQLTMIYRADLKALQGAFNLLEEEGLVRTVSRQGTFINTETVETVKKNPKS